LVTAPQFAGGSGRSWKCSTLLLGSRIDANHKLVNGRENPEDAAP
jgi:hypothetical protein